MVDRYAAVLGKFLRVLKPISALPIVGRHVRRMLHLQSFKEYLLVFYTALIE